jgi:hypothetical protein
MLIQPKTRLSLYITIFIVYWLSPWAHTAYVYRKLGDGAYPVDSDSIGIPISGFVMLWFIGIPIIICSFGIFE